MFHRRSHRIIRNSARLLAALFALLALCAHGDDPAVEERSAPEARPWNDEALLEMEAVTETLVNRLHDLSHVLVAVDPAKADLKDAAPFFAETLQGATIVPNKPIARQVEPWLAHHTWAIGEPRSISRTDHLGHLGAFLGRLATIDRVRFEVPESTVVSAGEMEARVTLSIYARNHDGQREWLQGEVAVRARREVSDDGAEGPGEWRLTAWSPSRLESYMATQDLFDDITAPTGLMVPDDLTLMPAREAGQRWYPNGAAAVDIDQDGLLDLFVTGPNGNFLYLNQGDGTFVDRAARTGLKSILPDKAELNPVFFDADNDGDADLFITSEHENVLLENRLAQGGRVFFRNISQNLPQNPEAQGWSVAVGDVNGDRLPDLYVVSYLSPLKGPGPSTTVDDVDGRPNLLLINRGDGTFADETVQWGVEDSRFSMAAQFADIDGDQDLDLFVANDFGGGNSLFINHGDRFVDEASKRGADFPAESMGVSFADYDNDGDLDLHITNMSSVAASRFLRRFDGLPLKHREHLERQWSGNALLANRGDGTFEDVSREAGPFMADWAWGGGFLDLDNDGFEDLHTPNGFLSGAERYDGRSVMFSRVILAMQEERRDDVLASVGQAFQSMGKLVGTQGYSFGGRTDDRVYLNRGDGTFLDIAGLARVDTYPSDARSSVYADFDNDGDHDIFLRATHGRAHFLFRNNIGQDNAFLRLTLEGTASGRDAYGTRVQVGTARGTYTKVKRGSNGYLAQNDPRLLFGLGEAPNAVEWIEVLWPSGTRQRFETVPAGSSFKLVEGEDALQIIEEPRVSLPGPTTGAAPSAAADAS